MRVLIIEDEEAAYKNLSKMLQNINNSIHIVGWLRSIKKTLDWYKIHDTPDLIFLDIKLLDGSSFELFEKIEINSPVVFTTAYSEYAVKAFEVNGIDYLLKPFNQERLKKSINKYLKYHTGIKAANFKEIIHLIKTEKTEDVYKSRFLVKVGDKYKTISIPEIAYFFRDKLVWLITKENNKYPIDYSLDDLEELLNPKIFFRVNRQYLVQINSIVHVYKYFKGKLKIKLSPDIDTELIISWGKASKFKDWLDGNI